MEQFIKEIQVRWSDLDPNFHLRHSVYYDWGAFCRVEYLFSNGLSAELMDKLKFGVILFREECVFRKEVRHNDSVSIDLQLLKARHNFSRWSIQHQIIKNGDTVAAILVVDGAWMDLEKRKLMTPPQEAIQVFNSIPQSENFQWLD